MMGQAAPGRAPPIAQPPGALIQLERTLCVALDAGPTADGARYVRRIAQAMRGKYGELQGSYLKETPAADEPPLDEIVDRLLIGDPATVAEKLAREIETVTPTHISCFMGIPGLSQPEMLRSIEQFGTRVVPLLEKRFGPLEDLRVAPKPARIAAA